MARGKGTAGNTAGGAYKPRKQTADKLRRAVENYNKRVVRRLKSLPEQERPLYAQPIKYKDIKGQFNSAREIQTYIGELNLYRGKGLELQEFGGEIATGAEIEIAIRRSRRENLKRRKILEKGLKIMGERGRFTTQQEQDLAPITPEELIRESRRLGREAKAKKKEEQAKAENLLRARITNLLEGRNIDDRALMLQQRYIFAVQQVRTEAILAGMLDDETSILLEGIESLIEGLTPEQVVAMIVGMPELHIENVTDIPFFLSNIVQYYETLREFIALW